MFLCSLRANLVALVCSDVGKRLSSLSRLSVQSVAASQPSFFCFFKFLFSPYDLDDISPMAPLVHSCAENLKMSLKTPRSSSLSQPCFQELHVFSTSRVRLQSGMLNRKHIRSFFFFFLNDDCSHIYFIYRAWKGKLVAPSPPEEVCVKPRTCKSEGIANQLPHLSVPVLLQDEFWKDASLFSQWKLRLKMWNHTANKTYKNKSTRCVDRRCEQQQDLNPCLIGAVFFFFFKVKAKCFL